jgi:hypothetical protein
MSMSNEKNFNINEVIATLDAHGEGRLAYELAKFVRAKDAALDELNKTIEYLDSELKKWKP